MLGNHCLPKEIIALNVYFRKKEKSVITYASTLVQYRKKYKLNLKQKKKGTKMSNTNREKAWCQ